MIAVAAAAHALDGFYGSVSRSSCCVRQRAGRHARAGSSRRSRSGSSLDAISAAGSRKSTGCSRPATTACITRSSFGPWRSAGSLTRRSLSPASRPHNFSATSCSEGSRSRLRGDHDLPRASKTGHPDRAEARLDAVAALRGTSSSSIAPSLSSGRHLASGDRVGDQASAGLLGGMLGADTIGFARDCAAGLTRTSGAVRAVRFPRARLKQVGAVGGVGVWVPARPGRSGGIDDQEYGAELDRGCPRSRSDSTRYASLLFCDAGRPRWLPGLPT